MIKLKRALKPLMRKLFIEIAWNYCLISVSIGAFFGGVLFIYSKFNYLQNMRGSLAAVFLLSVIIGLIIAFTKRPGILETAKVCDSLGFKERFITALELKSGEGVFENLVLSDAVSMAENNDMRKLYKMRLPKKTILMAFILFAFFFISGFTPGLDKEALLNRQNLNQKVADEIKKIDKVLEDTKTQLTDAQKAEVDKIINELKRDMQSAKSEISASEALKKAQTRLKKLEKSMPGLSKESLKSIEEAAKSGSSEAAAEAIENAMKNAGDSEKELLSELSEAISAGNAEKAQEILDGLSESAKNNDGLSEKLSSAISEINGQMAQSSQEMRDGKPQSDSQNQGGEQGQNQGQSPGGKQGNNEGEGQGQSQGQEQGQGEGQGQGQGESQGQGQSQGQNGSGRGSGHIENETIYSRDAEKYSDYQAEVKGREGDGGEYSQQDVKAIGEKGEIIPFQSVYQEYKNEAVSSLDDYEIPHGMKEIIKDYFSNLE